MPSLANFSCIVITVSHNRATVTQRFAEHLASQTYKDIALLLIDDGSTDNTVSRVQETFVNTFVRSGNGNLWWAGGLQKALNVLNGHTIKPDTIIVFMNDDTTFPPDYFERGVAELQALPRRTFLVSPGKYFPSGKFTHEAGITNWSRMQVKHFGNHPERIDHSTTRALFMRWTDLRIVGGFHPTLLPHYTSDYEFTMRAHRKGISFVPARKICAQFYDETTGSHGLKGMRFGQKFRMLFNRRFSFHLPSMFMFVWYASPLIWKIPNWTRICITAVKHLR